MRWSRGSSLGGKPRRIKRACRIRIVGAAPGHSCKWWQPVRYLVGCSGGGRSGRNSMRNPAAWISPEQILAAEAKIIATYAADGAVDGIVKAHQFRMTH